MFIDIALCCRPEQLTVYARFLRRGGIDINPFRSNFEPAPTPQRTHARTIARTRCGDTQRWLRADAERAAYAAMR